MKRARLIYNPSSGKEAGRKRLADILTALEEAGYEASAFATQKKDDATKEAERASDAGFDLIVAAGGDGTVYEVINGMAKKENRPKLGILPFGTSNDFARALGISKENFQHTLDVLKAGATQKVDVGKMNQRYFINIAGGGSLTELTYEVPSKLKTVFGQLAYYVKGVEKVAQFKPYHIRANVDGNEIEEEIMLFLVSNTNVVGGFDKLAPFADYTDGMFDVLMLRKCNVAELGRVMSRLINGEHIHDPKVLHFRASKIDIVPSKNIQINLDGELGGIAPCYFEVLPQHLEVIVNQEHVTQFNR
ncbi:diacylglycerol kinase [Priestia megaterium]|nr:diacylglycerol kinase [Priestia megaterium]